MHFIGRMETATDKPKEVRITTSETGQLRVYEAEVMDGHWSIRGTRETTTRRRLHGISPASRGVKERLVRIRCVYKEVIVDLRERSLEVDLWL
jgi:hypothetical protein